jgi:sulfhydrogenase subunit beta (sulfur reductase)
VSDRVLIDSSTFEALFAALAQAGVRVLSPRVEEGRVDLAEVRSPAEVSRDHVQTVGSAKMAVFPPVEKILGYRGAGAAIQIEDPEPLAQPTVVLGLRPCDARSFAALDAVFNWDTRDRFFDARMRALTVVSIACTRADDACFCTSVGGGPDDPQGSDVLLLPLADGGFAADVRTEKGRALLSRLGTLSPLPPDATLRPPAEVPRAVHAPLAAEIDRHFESEAWAEQSLRCLGCGTCAFVCPTCACFDIQDEQETGGGRRLRCWDSCGLRQFTLHASGHNPREHQDQRWRQRVSHKFLYFPERFGLAGCVGCGRCTRACPVDMNLKEHLVALAGGA